MTIRHNDYMYNDFLKAWLGDDAFNLRQECEQADLKELTKETDERLKNLLTDSRRYDII